MIAHYKVRNDFDYKEMVRACGAAYLELQPREDNIADLFIEGSQEAIDSFSADLSRGPC